MTAWQSSFAGLISNPHLGLRLCRLAASGHWSVPRDLPSLCQALREAQSSQSRVAEYLRSSTLPILFHERGREWLPADDVPFGVLADQLQGVVQADALRATALDKVAVVLTKPPSPSRMAERLDQSLRGDWGIQDTASLLPWLVDQARERVVVLTPYIDEVGAEHLIRLFVGIQAPEKYLVFRNFGPTSHIFEQVRPQLADAGVKFRNYRIPRGDGSNETFHAKVVLVDRRIALVGSFNFLASSLEYSLEMGLQVMGSTAGRVADVMDVILDVALPI